MQRGVRYICISYGRHDTYLSLLFGTLRPVPFEGALVPFPCVHPVLANESPVCVVSCVMCVREYTYLYATLPLACFKGSVGTGEAVEAVEDSVMLSSSAVNLTGVNAGGGIMGEV